MGRTRTACDLRDPGSSRDLTGESRSPGVPSSLGKLRFPALFVAILGSATACGNPPPIGADGGVETDGGFDDHTQLALAARADFDRFARSGPSTRSVEFTISGFSTEGGRALHFLDGNFYSLHDEWYWFRLLNGQPIPGDDVAPVRGFHFTTIELIYGWARAAKSLPLDLSWVSDGRLYSPRFYELALGARPRKLGLGTLVHVPARTTPEVTPERWAFELEYTHDVTHEELVMFFSLLESKLPAEIYANLKWLVRSPVQETLASMMEAQQLQFHDRILRYRDIAVAGEHEVYSSAIAAGRLRIIKAGESIEAAQSGDILLLEQTPDFLPPCSGLITAVPQTPLAHVNFLARNRGIPNVYIGGALDDPNIDQLARVRAPVILRGELPDKVELVAITEQEYQTYIQLGTKPTLSVNQPDLTGVANIYDLAPFTAADIDRLRPIVGGKVVGMLAIVSSPGPINHPEKPMGLSIKPFLRHVEPFRARLEEMLRNTDFIRDARMRYLVLEGSDDYDLLYFSPQDQTFKASMVQRYPAGSTIGEFIRQKGVRGMIRAAPMDPTTLADITAAIQRQYSDYDVHQGLRFRSSSNVEDIEGFNGAGLYDSNTGYIDAAAQPLLDDQKRTLEYAIKKTWASYWASEAFEERALEKINHLSGAMGVLIHARFDDEKERANGVFTYTIQPAELADERVFELNVQKGALSVTNPVPGDPNRPEIDQVLLARGAAQPRIERVRRSTLSTDADLLSDAQLLELYGEATAIADAWFQRQHQGVAPAKASRTLTLDFEFRYVADNWPALRTGQPFTSRIVIKQARSLDPGLRSTTPQLDALPFPKDIRTRAAKIQRHVCTGGALEITAYEAFTDPLIRPDLGYSVKPFTALVSVGALMDVPSIGLVMGSTLSANHLDMRFSHPEEQWSLHVELSTAAAARVGFERLDVRSDHTISLRRNAIGFDTSYASCSTDLLFASPKDYLVGLLALHAQDH